MQMILKKVKVHNLKGIDLTIPSGKLVVFTGVSGSGKSSLVFDTIYTEGQRRYLEALSHQTRRGLVELPKPDAQSITGIAPCIALEQNLAPQHQRSTVGTLTGIYNYLRVLFARVGIPHCPVSGESISLQSREAILAKLNAIPEGTKLILLAPCEKPDRDELIQRGFLRVRMDGAIIELEEVHGTLHGLIDIVVDRLVRSPENRSRLNESALQALELGNGFFSILIEEKEIFFSEHSYSKKSGISYAALKPQDFSFNHPDGMCPSCHGLGGACEACRGARIKPYPAATELGKKTLFELVQMPIDRLLTFFEELRLPRLEATIAKELLKEIQDRLAFLSRIGLSYLSLDRSALTLSGGEAQRVRLAAHIGSGLVGAIYVLDEPSLGLHPYDHQRLLEMLFHLRDLGNSVLVVEHDLSTVRAADYLVDMGPGAGPLGGEILASGTVDEVMRNPRSITGAYLSGTMKLEMPKKRRKVGAKKITIQGATHHNLKNIDASIPLEGLICITGVSGSGKSSLINEILVPALSRKRGTIGAHRAIRGLEHVKKLIAVDQSPIGRTSRSNAATYCKFFDEIREKFARLNASRELGLTIDHFSFNNEEGCCSTCKGLGKISVDRDFMDAVWLGCPECKGKRYDQKSLTVRYRGKTIADVLEMTVDEALKIFDYPALSLLQRVGLGYLTLGQSATTLSGGEAQRIKLAKELSRPSGKGTLYVFDEPTSGLHLHDLQLLLDIFQELVNKGATVLVIEHNMELVRCADWVVDLGPGAGEKGGRIVGTGTPEQLSRLSTPTGKALKSNGIVKGLRPFTGEFERQRLSIRGAKTHTLKNISLSLPHNQMTVVTGVSGSGKSSFAFDTVFAEGQRRFAETLPAYARGLLQELPKPDVEEISGLSPVLALEQTRGGVSRRSTVGTITEIYDLLRIVFAHVGEYNAGGLTAEDAADDILKTLHGEKIQILSPLRRPKDFGELRDKLDREGFLRIRLNGKIYALDDRLPWKKKNELYLVIDRLVVGDRERLIAAIEKVQERGDLFVVGREDEDVEYSLAREKVTANTFSFNSDEGMCPRCRGLGVTYGAHLEEMGWLKVLSVLALMKKGSERAFRIAGEVLTKCGVDGEKPLMELTKEQLNFVLQGADEAQLVVREDLSLKWIGLNALFEGLARSGKGALRKEVKGLLQEKVCEECGGERLNGLARSVRVKGSTLAEVCGKTVRELALFVKTIEEDEVIAEPLAQMEKRLKILLDLDLHYLSLDRMAPTLSGGELQRLRLSAQLGTGLTSCLTILDEPTIGLHPKNSAQLLKALEGLRELGNTLLVVEHDPLVIQYADHVVEFGPKAGKEGGEVIAQGTVEELLKNRNSLTGAYLSGKRRLEIPKQRRPFSPDIRIEHATLHNLKDLTLAFPKGAITCLTGVSGSGKSTLMHDLLKKATTLDKAEPVEFLGTKFYGLSDFEQVVVIDQTPLGQVARADVSTYTGLLPLIRKLLAQLPTAQVKGLQPSHFSFNHRDGMCHTCKGLGYRTVDLQFLPDVKVLCEECRGYRLGPASLEIRYKGKHLGQILEMTIAEALEFFGPIPQLRQRLQSLIESGLSYLHLNQELATISGGEAQRLRLSRELAKRESGKTLYLIDEPTIGLHSEDIAHLLPIFHRLVNKKNTLLIVEHNLDVIANADYVIDLGPEAGAEGGWIVAQGTPEEVAKEPKSYTGKFLATISKLA